MSTSRNFSVRKGFAPIVILFIIAAAVLAGSVTYWQLKTKTVANTSLTPQKIGSTSISNTNVSTPTPQATPIDITKWQLIDTNLGFTFKCPPAWYCKKFSDSSFYIGGNNSGISTFQINIITPTNYQNSFLRHPSYNNAVDWFNDLKAKKEIALKVFPETIFGYPGTDGKSYPVYYNYKSDEITEVAINGEKAIYAKADKLLLDDVLIPLNRSDLILVSLGPQTLYSSNQTVRAVISTIQASN